jgi:hypothetical protein
MTNSNYEVVAQFIMSNDDGFKLNQTFSDPLYLDITNYNYYLKVLSLQFSNVVPNITDTLSTNGTTIVEPGIYEVENLVDAYNVNSNTLGTLSINTSTGKLSLTNTTGASLTIISDNFLTSSVCGFSLTLPFTLADGANITAANIVKISEYNFFVLKSTNVNGYTRTSRNSGPFLPTDIIYTITSAIPALAFKTWVSMQPIQFKIDSQVLNYLNFELCDAFNRTLDILPGASTDFCVVSQIVKCKKM